MEQELIPKVFISYSHDNSVHKQWVGELGSKLVKNGIDVILDQWDLGLGDDIPKFMEYAVSNANRVLMICTETYVKKANEGTGGVDYEAMIVTGELVRNLGTSKFIPVIRQKSEKTILPKSVSTRFYIDLSESQDADEQFQLLLRELHQEPVFSKPSLGKNPFSRQSSGTGTPFKDSNHNPIPELNMTKDVVTVYNAAIDIVRQGDLIAWRKIIQQIRQPLKYNLISWREKAESISNLDEQEFYGVILEGASVYAPLFSIALAGVESGRDLFNNQISIIDDILYPKAWKWSGSSSIVELPCSVAYIYQALHGAVGILTGQLSISIRLANAKVELPLSSNKKSLFQFPEIIGWPKSFGDNASIAWNLLINLPKEWSWLNSIFGDIEDFQVAVCAYYMALNILEFSSTISTQKGIDVIRNANKDNEICPDIPPVFYEADSDVKKRAYRLLLNTPEQIREIWSSVNLSNDEIESLWNDWIKIIRGWLRSSYRLGFRNDVPHKDLFIDLK